MKINDYVKFALLIIVMVFCIASAFMQPKYPVAYDCRISEISPDVPPAVKEQCRKRQPAWVRPQEGL
mgnify:CR=1 FL=1